MYLHVGNGDTVRREEIIGIFDMDTATTSSATRRYLTRAEKEKRTFSVEDELPKCFIVLSGPRNKRLSAAEKQNEKDRVVFLRISSVSLRARAETDDWSDDGGSLEK